MVTSIGHGRLAIWSPVETDASKLQTAWQDFNLPEVKPKSESAALHAVCSQVARRLKGSWIVRPTKAPGCQYAIVREHRAANGLDRNEYEHSITLALQHGMPACVAGVGLLPWSEDHIGQMYATERQLAAVATIDVSVRALLERSQAVQLSPRTYWVRQSACHEWQSLVAATPSGCGVFLDCEITLGPSEIAALAEHITSEYSGVAERLASEVSELSRASAIRTRADMAKDHLDALGEYESALGLALTAARTALESARQAAITAETAASAATIRELQPAVDMPW